jgi:hypothetical protein
MRSILILLLLGLGAYFILWALAGQNPLQRGK